MMAVNDAGNSCQSYPRPLEILVSMEAMERSEELVGVVHVEPSAVVAHVEGTLLLVPTELDEGGGDLGGEFDAVSQQVFKSDAHEARVTGSGKAGLDAEFDLSLGIFEDRKSVV